MSGSGVRVMVSVDVEEDDWGSYAPSGASTRNIRRLPGLCELLERRGARPTFFINRPPLVSPASARILRDLVESGACEVATHCHPWNTPPLEGPPGEAGSMMSRLGAELNRAKVAEVHRLLLEELGATSTAFRAGRWGFGPSVARPLLDLGYRVDSSVCPLMDWSEIDGPDHSGAPMLPYRFHPDEPATPAADGPLLEIPVTLGFLRGDPRRALRMRRALVRGPLRPLKVVGLLDRLGILVRRWLSPETSTSAEMTALARALVRRHVRVLNLTFHSSALLPGATPFVADEEDHRAFLARIDRFLGYCVAEGFTFATVGDVARAHAGVAPAPGAAV